MHNHKNVTTTFSLEISPKALKHIHANNLSIFLSRLHGWGNEKTKHSYVREAGKLRRSYSAT